MNTLAFLAFLVGINGTNPGTSASAQEQKQKNERPAPKPGKDLGSTKSRSGGGWDCN